MKVLQTSALPLGYGAVFSCLDILSKYMRFVKTFFIFLHGLFVHAIAFLLFEWYDMCKAVSFAA